MLFPLRTNAFPDTRSNNTMELPELFSDDLCNLFIDAINHKSHPLNDTMEYFELQLECHSIEQPRLRLAINMRGCRMGYNGNIECRLTHTESNSALNIENSKAPALLGKIDNSKYFECNTIEWDPITSKADIKNFQIHYTTFGKSLSGNPVGNREK